jgi:hypothetical protein
MAPGMEVARMNLVGFVVLSLTVVAAGDDTLGIQLPSWVTESLKQSPALVFGLVVFVLAFRHIQKVHEQHLASKNAEIDRLVKERDKLQNLILKNRLSTEEPPPPPPPPSAPKRPRK